MPTNTITVYGSNRLDQARDIVPQELAQQFVEAVRSGYFDEPCGGGLEHAYRLWLTDPGCANVSWDKADDDALMDALREADDETRTMLIAAVWGE